MMSQFTVGLRNSLPGSTTSVFQVTAETPSRAVEDACDLYFMERGAELEDQDASAVFVLFCAEGCVNFLHWDDTTTAVAYAAVTCSFTTADLEFFQHLPEDQAEVLYRLWFDRNAKYLRDDMVRAGNEYINHNSTSQDQQELLIEDVLLNWVPVPSVADVSEKMVDFIMHIPWRCVALKPSARVVAVQRSVILELMNSMQEFFDCADWIDVGVTAEVIEHVFANPSIEVLKRRDSVTFYTA